MIYHPVNQRSAEWFYLRIGLPTASDFERIMTPGGKLSKQAEDYAHKIIAELMLGHPLESAETEWMIRGQDLEDSAIEAYEMYRERETGPGGFCVSDDRLYGCSPDRLVGEAGVLEIKCPAPNTHVRYLDDPLSLASEKKPQVQGELLVTGREWCDLMSYHPELPPVIARVKRDEPYIKTLLDALVAFSAQISAMRRNLESRYGSFRPITIPKPVSLTEDPLGISDADVAAIWRSNISGKEPR